MMNQKTCEEVREPFPMQEWDGVFRLNESLLGSIPMTLQSNILEEGEAEAQWKKVGLRSKAKGNNVGWIVDWNKYCFPTVAGKTAVVPPNAGLELGKMEH